MNRVDIGLLAGAVMIGAGWVSAQDNPYVTPAACAATGGNIAIEMYPNCGVQEASTVGACKVQGLPNPWSW